MIPLQLPRCFYTCSRFLNTLRDYSRLAWNLTRFQFQVSYYLPHVSASTQVACCPISLHWKLFLLQSDSGAVFLSVILFMSLRSVSEVLLSSAVLHQIFFVFFLNYQTEQGAYFGYVRLCCRAKFKFNSSLAGCCSALPVKFSCSSWCVITTEYKLLFTNTSIQFAAHCRSREWAGRRGYLTGVIRHPSSYYVTIMTSIHEHRKTGQVQIANTLLIFFRMNSRGKVTFNRFGSNRRRLNVFVFTGIGKQVSSFYCCTGNTDVAGMVKWYYSELIVILFFSTQWYFYRKKTDYSTLMEKI